MNDRDRDWFVARMGHSTVQDGFPKIAGQLFAPLLWSEEPCSIQEMTDILGVSKASVSTNARRVLEHGVFERVPREGDRRDFYKQLDNVHAVNEFVPKRLRQNLADLDAGSTGLD